MPRQRKSRIAGVAVQAAVAKIEKAAEKKVVRDVARAAPRSRGKARRPAAAPEPAGFYDRRLGSRLTPSGVQPITESKSWRSVDDVLRKHNDYFQSLADPIKYGGARIPDPVTTPSSIFRVTVKGEFTTPTSGFAAITFGGNGVYAAGAVGALNTQSMLIPTAAYVTTSGGSPASAANSWGIGWVSGPLCVTGDLMANPTLITSAGWNATSDSIPQVFGNARLISAVLIVQPIGAALTSKGKMVGASLPRLATMKGTGGSTSFAELENKPDAFSIPINQNKPINVFYQSMDPASWQYAPITRSNSSPGQRGVLCFTGAQQQTALGAVAAMYIPEGGFDTDEDMAVHSPGELWVGVSGAEESQPFAYTYVANYEAIPWQASTMLTQVEVSKSDPLALAHAANALADRPKVMAGNELLVPTLAPGISHSREPSGPTLMEKVLSGVVDVGKAAGRAALGPLGAFLS